MENVQERESKKDSKKGKVETEWMRCDAGRQSDMAGALSRIKKGPALFPVLARQTWQAF